MAIHPTAIIDPSASIGTGCDIGPYSVIGPEVRIARDCRIESHVVIEGPSVIGEGNSISHHAVIGTAPQDVKFKGGESRLEIGNGNVIREFATVNRGTPRGGGVTVIGDNCFLMAYIHVAHDCKLGDRVIMANCATLAGHVKVCDGANFGGLAAVHQYAHVGRMAFIGGGAMVRRDVPPFVIARGDRARLVGINRVGLERALFDDQRIEDIESIYRLLWKHGWQAGIERLEGEFADNEDAKLIREFLADTELGLCAPRED